MNGNHISPLVSPGISPDAHDYLCTGKSSASSGELWASSLKSRIYQGFYNYWRSPLGPHSGKAKPIQRCYGNLRTVVEIGLNSAACSLWDAMLSCCYGLAAVPVSGLTATWGFFRYCGAFQMAAKCMSLSLQDESHLRSLCIALSLEALQCSPHQVFRSY